MKHIPWRSSIERSVLHNCLRGIEKTLSSNDARTDPCSFACKQLRIVLSAATVLCRIDPHDSIAIPPERLGYFVQHTKRILKETATGINYGARGTEDRLLKRANLMKSSTASSMNELHHLRTNALVSFIISLGYHKVLHMEASYAEKVMTQVDIRSVSGSSLVSLIGSFHKSELYKASASLNFVEDAFTYIVNTSSVLKRLTSREMSLLLWRRFAMLYMGVPLREFHIKQIRCLVYQCYEKIREELLMQRVISESMKGGDEDELCSFMAGKRSDATGILANTDDRNMMKLRQTLTNISHAMIILLYFEASTMGHCSLLDMIGHSMLVRLHRILNLMISLGNSKTGDHISSDTHNKVILTIRDVIEQGNAQCLHEQPVGISSYTIDVLLKSR